jgi:hypothetical protein
VMKLKGFFALAIVASTTFSAFVFYSLLFDSSAPFSCVATDLIETFSDSSYRLTITFASTLIRTHSLISCLLLKWILTNVTLFHEC